MRKILVLGLILMMVGCSKENISKETILIIHNNVEYEVVTNPTRLAVWDLGILDIIDTIGLDKLGIEAIAVPSATYPSYLAHYNQATHVGTMKEYNPTALDLFEPELIIYSGRMAPEADNLATFAKAINLATANANLIDSFKNNIATLKKIFTASSYHEALDQCVADVEAKLAETKAITSQSTAKVLFVMANSGSFSLFNSASDGRYQYVFNEFGVIDAAPLGISSDNHGGATTEEGILNINPDKIMIMDRGVIALDTWIPAKTSVNSSQILKETQAYLNDEIYYFDGSTWYLAVGGYNATLKMLDDVISCY